VLIHADEEPDLVADQPVIPGDGIGADLLEGVAQMRLAVGVIDGGGDVESGHDMGASGA